MLRPFQFFQQRRHIVVALSCAKSHGSRLHFKSPRWLGLACVREAQAEHPVHDDLEGLAGATDFLLEQSSDIVVYG